MDSNVVLKASGVSKKFCKNLKKSMIYSGVDLVRGVTGFREERSRLRSQEFWALKDISFTLKRGESLSLIGVNGSGKSTLLRLIAGLYPPDQGEISVSGTTASMIAVGAGFHPHMTGRENVYLNGAILGMSKEYIKQEFDSIVDFAGVEDFLDSPVATYSSGMRVRLGFAIASASKPDLLLLDEILAVGDRQFKVKCYNRIAKLKEQCAVVFVSHNMNEVQRVTSKSLFLEKGKVQFYGDVNQAVREYVKRNALESSFFIKTSEFLKFDKVTLDQSKLGWNGSLSVQCDFTSEKSYGDCLVRITFHDDTSRDIANWQSKNHEVSYEIKKGKNTFVSEIKNILFKTGEYKVSYVICPCDETDYLLVANEVKSIFLDSVPGYASYQL